jgi:hypothetical protein
VLFQNHLIAALEEKREDFSSFDKSWRNDLAAYSNYLNSRITQAELKVLKDSKGPGAIPSPEYFNNGTTVLEFENRWTSHEEARSWAVSVLQNRVTFAVDGSQYVPSREVSVPVAAIQIGLFENPHTQAGQYRKEVEFKIVTPSEILATQDESESEAVIAFKRFSSELHALGEFLSRQAGWASRGERMPVAFFDGSLLVSYSTQRTRLQQKYISEVLRVIDLSQKTQVPVVGFIDRSYARDVIKMLQIVSNEVSPTSTLYDAQLFGTGLNGEGFLQNWGDRTTFFGCLREGFRDDFCDSDKEPLVGFIYLQTTSDGDPARLDIPCWIQRSGMLDELADVVRAECVVGNGYPYSIETADAVAVISAQDRSRFLRAVQSFSEARNLDFRLSRKLQSKSRRRL